MPRPQVVNITPLLQILQQEAKLIEKLLELSEAQSAAVIEQDIEHLQALIAEQETVVLQCRGLERERISAARAMAWAVQLPPSSGLLQIIGALPSGQKLPLARVRHHLLQLQQQLAQAQNRNRTLIENALHITKFHINLLTATALQTPAYGSNLTRIVNPAFYIDSHA